MDALPDVPSFRLPLPRRVLVSGAGGGIGGEIVRQLAAAGSEVVGVGRSDAPPSDFAGAHWIAADIANPEDRRRVARAAGPELGGVVHAAGILDGADWIAMQEEAAGRLLAVNLLAPFFLTRDLLPQFAPEASVVIIGSIAGARASPATPIYGASKAGLRNLSASLALLLQPLGARANLLAPGLIDTPLTDGLNRDLAAARGVDMETIVQDRAAAIPLGRAGTPRECADACLFLLSSASSYFSGASLYPTGGALAGAI